MKQVKKIHPWPFGIAVGLLIVILVNLFVIWLAHNSPHQLLSENYYEEALNYDQLRKKSTDLK